MSRRAVPPPNAVEPLALGAARFRDDVARLIDGDAASVRRPLLLAVSGGPDSMAMLTLAVAAMSGRIAVATVDHRLRLEAAAEAAMVSDWCATIGVPHATLAPSMPVAGASIQAQARFARYALLADHARGIGAAAILTAHHADDQAETFLMRAARGSGLSGLAGVRARTTIANAAVVRPLLDWRRAELRAIVRRLDVPFIDDPTNADPAHDRTRFRRLLVENEWLGVPQLARSAQALAEADGDLRAVTDWLWTERSRGSERSLTIDVAALPREVRRRLARRAIGTVRQGAGIVAPVWSEAANIEPLLEALEGGKRATQAGVLADARGTAWRFRAAPPRRPRE